MLKIHGVQLSRGNRLVLDRVDLTAHTGQLVGVLGPNGSGKTTLLRILYDSLRPQAGEVDLDGTPVRAMTRTQIAQSLAVVAQQPDSDLPITVAETVMLGRLPHRPPLARPRPADHTAVEGALHHVHLAHLADRLVSQLSGGERQRVLIARAIAQQAGHLLLDEPTNHLDVRFQHETLQLVRGLDTTTVITLHDLNLASRYCDAVVLLNEGRVVTAGIPNEVLIPATLEPIYDVAVRCIDVDGYRHLVFGPPATLDSGPPPPHARNQPLNRMSS